MIRLSFVVLVIAACSSKPVPSPAVGSAPGSAAPVAAAGSAGSSTADETPYRCDTDADCMVSCAHGAVNKKWYEAANLTECKDGCAEGNDPRCIAKQCVAQTGDGKRDDACTHRPIVHHTGDGG